MRQQMTQLPWRLIVSLGVLALIRPIVKVLGDVFSYDVSPFLTIIITVAIALVWIGTVVKLRVKRPIVVLTMSGAVYAVLSIAMAIVIQLFAPDLGDDEAKIPVLLTAGLVATTIFNSIYGAFLGYLATLFQKAAK